MKKFCFDLVEKMNEMGLKKIEEIGADMTDLRYYFLSIILQINNLYKMG